MDEFSPPFCPHADCPCHETSPHQIYRQYQPWGSYSTKTFGTVPRYRCLVCLHTFSAQTFSVDYYAKRRIDYPDLLERLVATSSLSAIGRAIKASTDTVSNRISRAARQGLALASRLSRTRRLGEDVAADGFESFCVSQYFPNNLTVLVGSESQFVYAADHATLRRKGRMTEAQKIRRSRLERGFRADPRALVKSFSRIAGECLSVLADESRPALVLWTDEHRAYPRGLAESSCAAALCAQGRVLHRTIPSRAARTRANPLFPVNYLDRELRKDLHEHVREGVCFGRNVNRQMERFALYQFYHNYLKRHRARWGSVTNALVAGYDAGFIEDELARVWKDRAFLSLTRLSESMDDTWRRSRATPLGRQRDYQPKYAVA
jgi:hypothetical protein